MPFSSSKLGDLTTNTPAEGLLAETDAASKAARGQLETIEGLTPEQRAAVKGVVSELAGRIREAVISATPREASGPKEVLFDEQLFRAKVAELRSYGSKVECEIVRDVPRSGVDGWFSNAAQIARKAAAGFFKIVFVRATNPTTGKIHVQPTVVQEDTQLDKGTADNVTGQIILPLRVNDDGVLEAGITIRNPVGSWGKPLFTAPRSSKSNPHQTAFINGGQIFKNKFMRADAMRMSGQIDTMLKMFSKAELANINNAEEKVVWFNMAELARLAEEGTGRNNVPADKMAKRGNGDESTDAPTLALINWTLRYQGQIYEEIQQL